MNIATYIRENGGFTSVDQASCLTCDLDYIEGYLEIRRDAGVLLGPRQWDYIDQLWSYLVQLASEVGEGRAAEFFFPDQPIRVSAVLRGDREVVLRVEGSSSDGEIVVSVVELMQEVRRAGTTFFRKMIEICPESHASSYEAELDRLQRLGT